MKVNFNLNNPKATDTTTIIMVCRWNAQTVKYSTQIKIKPKQWNNKKQLVYPGIINSSDINAFLKQLEKKALDFYFSRKTQNIIISKTDLKTFLHNTQTNQTAENKNFETIVKEYLAEKSKLIKKTSLQKNNSFFKTLFEYAKETKQEINFTTLNSAFLMNYTTYLAYTNHQTNESIRDNKIKKLKVFLNWSLDKGYNINDDFKKFKFPYKVVQSDQVYLTEAELNKLHNLKLENSYLDKIRDVFLIECYTGLRYSDLKQIRFENIKENRIKITQQKTAKTVFVPIASEARKIMDKYFSKGLELPIISNQKMNQYLKDLCQLAKINEPTTKIRFSGTNRTEVTEPKYSFVASHTARRTFVTVAYLRGMKPLEIMKITGHTNYTTFMKYAKLDELSTNESFYKAWDGTNPEVTRIIENLIKEKIPIEVISRATGVPIENIKK